MVTCINIIDVTRFHLPPLLPHCFILTGSALVTFLSNPIKKTSQKGLRAQSFDIVIWKGVVLFHITTPPLFPFFPTRKCFECL